MADEVAMPPPDMAGLPSPGAAAEAAAAVDLTEEMMDLSQVGKTIDGEGFCFFQLDCIDKNVRSLELLAAYEHLRQIDLSKNRIQDVTPLAGLRHVLRLNLSSNEIEDISSWREGTMAHLLRLDFGKNRMKALPPLPYPALQWANFAGNEIATCEAFTGHQTLETLDLSENRLEALKGICDMPVLRVLNVASNRVTNVCGLSRLPVLSSLDISKNSFETLGEGSWWAELARSLQSLRVEGNSIAESAALGALSQLSALDALWVSANPLADEDGANIRLEVLIWSSSVQKVDDEEVAEEERVEAKELHEARLEEERERRIAEEEEAAAAAAAAADEEPSA